MVFPNFLVIGSAKGGTTSLYTWLAQHPQIYMTRVKETNFFALQGEELSYPAGTISRKYLAHCKTNLQAYINQFRRVTDEIAIGEVSPIYLYHPQAAERIKHSIPDAKLIAILRNPVERAYSNFLHHVREGFETFTDFEQALQAEENRIRDRWWWGFYYINGGFYAEQLKRYFDRFERSQIRIYLYEDLQSDPQSLLRDIFQFLQVDPTFMPDISEQYNKTGIPKNKLLHRLLSQKSMLKSFLKLIIPSTLRKQLRIYLTNRNLVKPPLPENVRIQLREIYRKDILQLQELLQRDLSHWLD